MRRLFIATVAILAGWGGSLPAAITVTTDFEGGSAIIEAVDTVKREVQIRPGGNPDRGWPCWWYLRIDGLLAGEDATVKVRGSQRHARNNAADTGKPLASSWSLPDRAAASTDGVTWHQTDPGDRVDDSVSYQFTGGGGPLWVAWGPPFTSSHSTELLDRAVTLEPDHARTFDLALSREQRPVRGLRITAEPGGQLPAVWVQARQHAWESGSSWVAAGFVDWLLGQEPEARWLRANGDLFVIPIMDIDRVATGDGGKESSPHDHNRDWSNAPHYPEIAATQQQLRSLTREGRLSLVLDLHNPGPGDQQPFFFLPPVELLSDRGRALRDRFVMFAARRLDRPLTLAATPRVTGSSYHPLWRQISTVWIAEHTNGDTVAACLETAWNTPHSTTAGYRGVGAKLGRAVADYIRFLKAPQALSTEPAGGALPQVTPTSESPKREPGSEPKRS